MPRFFLLAVALIASSTVHAAASIEGAWQLQEYVLDGKDVPVSGTLIFTAGHFGMVYRMGAAADSGRGHGGTYRVEENRILFSIPFWLQYVDGASRVMAESSDAVGRFEIDGDELRIRYENDALQRFKRAPAAKNPLDGAWKMAGYESEAKTGNADGLALFHSGNFVLIYTMATGGKTPDARAHAGGFATEGSTLTLKVESSIHCVGGAGRVERTPSPRDMELRLEGGKLDLGFASGARMSFVRP
jgi:hypothetical protein